MDEPVMVLKNCRWCGDIFTPRPGETPSKYMKRKCCARSCAVSYQNHMRARENRILKGLPPRR